MPAGLPAIWEEDFSGRVGECAVRLYLRADLPQYLADHYRLQAVRSVLPNATLDTFTVTPVAQRIMAAVA